MVFEHWPAVREALRAALCGLDDASFVVLGEPAPPMPSGRRWPSSRTRPTPTRYVQVLRVTDLLSAECVGPTTLGGAWDMSESTIQVLRELGWRTPGEREEEFDSLTSNLDVVVELSEVEGVGDLLVATLQLLGARPGDLVLETSAG
ncbi:MAG: hypothetical protein JWR42_1961 [Marmoricola sp.]|nr:hypothetical protein [Marmoricola sp.]